VFQTIGFYGFQNWVPTLLIAQGVEITKSLGFTTLIALAAPLGPLLGFFVGDRIERKWVIVGAAATMLVCGLAFGATTLAPVIVAMGLMLQIAANGMSYSFHAYQQELFPTGLRARASGFVYSWSRLSVIFSSFVIAYILKVSGAPGVFAFIAAAMAVVIVIIGVFGPRVSGVALEKISG
jgi:putative MFS transporter